MVSLDGFFEGPDKELDWHIVDSEFNQYSREFLDSVDTLLFGRVTYELMAGYWPSEHAVKNDALIATPMNSLKKLVASRSLKQADWNNTEIIGSNVENEIRKLKQQPGKDIAIFGSSDLAVTLIKNGLIDEYRITVSPVVLGGGKRLFEGLNERLRLQLIDTKVFHSGNVVLYYQQFK